MRGVLGLQRYPQDLLRHTAASYLIELLGDTAKVAKRLGNSEKTLCSHYYAPITKETSELFWYVPPPKAAPALPKFESDTLRRHLITFQPDASAPTISIFAPATPSPGPMFSALEFPAKIFLPANQPE